MCNKKPSHLLIVGDFNIKDINWVDMTSATDEAHISTKFIECIRDCFLLQHVMEPTRFRSDNVPSLLDLIFTNEENMVLNLSTLPGLGKSDHVILKVSKGAKIRNRYNQVPHLTQDTNGKVTNSQLDTTNESQEVSPFPAGDHKAHINRRAQRHSKHKTGQKHKISTKEVPPWNGQ